MQGRYIHPLDETKGRAKLKGRWFSDVSSLAPGLVRRPRLLDEVLLTLGSDDRRARMSYVTDCSSFVLFLSLVFDNVETIEQILFISSLMDASGGDSPHPAQETTFFAGVDGSGASETLCVVLQERAPRDTPRREPRDRSRVFKFKSSVLGSVDQPNGQSGERRRGG